MQELSQRARADAAGLRRVAGVYRSRAARIAEVDRRIHTQLTTLTFEGPAGTHFRQAMDAEHQRLGKLRSTLDELANALSRIAAELEADPAGGYAALQGIR